MIIILLIIFIALLIGLPFIFDFFRRPPLPDLPQAEPPAGTQLFLFPITNGAVTAGYRNAKYLEKNGFPHFGIDVTSSDRYGDILASGNGVVLGTEACNNGIGNIAVIQYNDVFVPQTGATISFIARYYHMMSISIKKGDAVSAGQIIGNIDNTHKWYNHVHLELDTDLDYPFHTPQVAEASSELLKRFPANGESIIEPADVLVLGCGQWAYIHPNSDCCTEKDSPRFAEKQIK